MAYATKDDVAMYTGKALEELPADIDRLLERASEVVDEATLGRIDPANQAHLDAARLATCAQVEYWLTAGEQGAIVGGAPRMSLGSLSVDYGSAGGPPVLAPRARRHLLNAGLLYRGVTA